MSSSKDVERSAVSHKSDAPPSKWHLIMNLNVWNRRKPNLFCKCQRAYMCLAVVSLLVIISLIVLIGQVQFLRNDVHALKSQIKCLRLKYKYEYQQNHSRLRRLAHNNLSGSINPFVREFSDLTEEERMDSKSESIKDDRVFVTDANTLTSNFYSNQETSLSVLERTMDLKNNTFEKTTVLNDTTSPMTVRNDLIDDLEKRNLSCGTTTCKMQTAKDATIDGGNELSLWNQSRSRRSRRDEGRGKKRRKNRRRPNRSCRRLGPMVATFIGAVPEQHIMNSATIGPWIKSDHDNAQHELTKFHLVEKNMAIEITTSGLYLISVQIFYFGETTKHSYWILLHPEGLSKARKLVKCSTTTSNVAEEVSCYTSIIIPMQKGDRLHLEQQERNRLINMRKGFSHIQLVLLANDTQRKRSA